MAPTSGNREAVEVGADENDACGRRGGEDTDPDWNTRMQSYADCLDWPLNRSFKAQELV
jgi:hypothetical protein